MQVFMQRNKVMRLISQHWIAIASLLTLPLHGVAAQEPLPFNEFRAGLIETVMNSCMRSQTEPAIQIYMDKANTQGANFTDHAQTLAHLEKMPEWTHSIVPKMKNLCACALGPSIEEMRATTSLDELEAVVRATKAAGNKRGADSAYMSTCLQAKKTLRDAG